MHTNNNPFRHSQFCSTTLISPAQRSYVIFPNRIVCMGGISLSGLAVYVLCRVCGCLVSVFLLHFWCSRWRWEKVNIHCVRHLMISLLNAACFVSHDALHSSRIKMKKKKKGKSHHHGMAGRIHSERLTQRFRIFCVALRVIDSERATNEGNKLISEIYPWWRWSICGGK